MKVDTDVFAYYGIFQGKYQILLNELIRWSTVEMWLVEPLSMDFHFTNRRISEINGYSLETSDTVPKQLIKKFLINSHNR